MDTTDGTQGPDGWPGIIYGILRSARVRQVGYVPDSGHTDLIRACNDDPDIACISLTSEEEGIGLITGAWLGGQRGALLMQSSGVGNCMNMFTLATNCRIPVLLLVTMRGEWGEFNPWQVPMGQLTPKVLADANNLVFSIDDPDQASQAVAGAARMAFEGPAQAAVLIGQEVIGAKSFGK